MSLKRHKLSINTEIDKCESSVLTYVLSIPNSSYFTLLLLHLTYH